MSGALNHLGVVRVAHRRCEVPRAAGPASSSWRVDLTVDGATLRERIVELAGPDLLGDTGLAAVADGEVPSEAAAALRRLTGAIERDPAWSVLAHGRLPLYVCPCCADVHCGAVTVAVGREVLASGGEVVRWQELRVEDGSTPAEEMEDLSALGPFVFDALQYDEALRPAVAHLDQLAETERAAAADRRARSLRGVLGRYFPV